MATAGFVRRYSFFPGVEVITLIEGIIIVDTPPAGSVQGVGTGTVALVGEFADMTFAVHVDVNGAVTTNPQPVEIFSGQDLLNKVGGFDATLGNFGNAGGNGFVELRNKKFSRLILVPVNLCSPLGTRMWRKLPTCTSSIDPTNVVPIQAATVGAGFEFKSGNNRVRTGAREVFTADAPRAVGADGAVTATPGAATPGQATSGPAPFFATPGEHTDVQIDAQPLAVATWAGTHGFKLGAGGTFVALNGTNLAIRVDGGPIQTLTFDNTAVDAATTAAFINAHFSGVVAVVVGGQVQIDSASFGTGSSINVTTTNAAAGFAVAGLGTAGTGDAANLAAMTAAEVAAKLAAAVGVTAVVAVVGNTVQITSATTGAASLVQIEATSTTSVGFDNAPHNGANAGPGNQPTQVFSSPGSNFVTDGVQVGDALVVGVIGGAGALGANADTYRVVTVAPGGITTELTVEKQDGTAFNWTTTINLPWRVHPGATADTGGAVGNAVTPGFSLAQAGGYSVPARPLDATIAQATNVPPTVAPPAATATTWDPLSGLTMRTHPNAPGLAFQAQVQAPNAANAAAIDALYSAAYDSLLSDEDPASDVNILWSARTSTNIRNLQVQHVVNQSQTGTGRSCLLWPELQVLTTSAAVSDNDPGVGAIRNERADYVWPGLKTFVPEAVNFAIATPLGGVTTDGGLSVSGAGWLAAVQSNLPPERDPGQLAEPVPTIMSPVIGFQDGAPKLKQPDYIALKRAGVCSPRRDKVAGFIFQSSVTTSLVPGQTDQNRRRFADFCEDSLAQALAPLSKLPISDQFKDTAVGEADAFGDELLSPNNVAASRIDGYEVDDKTGNTNELEEQGIFVLIFRVRMTPIAKFIVLQAEVGTGVDTSSGVNITRLA